MQFSPIKWINNNPYSIDFNDIYFSTVDGLQETETIFITQNQLKDRFETLKNSTFSVIETGFGTGLNFFCTAAHWLNLAPENAQLHFVSIEKYPLKPEDIQKVAQLYPQFHAISAEFLQQYANLTPNFNAFTMAGSRIHLVLWIGDILNILPQINGKADAWFLDGFAPAKNAEMWSNDVFEHVARLSKTNATFATFTSAGSVRRGLLAVGFEVKKAAGFGKKREMLRGAYAEKPK